MDIETFDKMLDAIIVDVKQQLRIKHKYDPDRHAQLQDNGNTKGCGCSICVAKYKYVAAQKALHKSNKDLDLLYEVLPDATTIQSRIERLEVERDNLKKTYHKLYEQIKEL